jgi:hypothetical protein
MDFDPITNESSTPSLHRINTSAMYELMHVCLGHPGERIMQDIHLHVDGIQKLRKPPFFKCGACALVNATKLAVTQKELTSLHNAPTQLTDNNEKNPYQHVPHQQQDLDNCAPGQMFHMDMGFVRSTKYHHRDNDET